MLNYTGKSLDGRIKKAEGSNLPILTFDMLPAIIIARPSLLLILKIGEDMQKEYSIAEAKNKLPSIIHDVESGSSAKFTRRGKPVAVLLSLYDYERLAKQKRSFWPTFQTFRSNAFKNRSVIINDDDFKGLRDTTPGRKINWQK